MITERCAPPDWDERDELESQTPNGRDPLETRDWSRVALAERVEYLMIAATAVEGAELTQQDTTRLQRLCRELELPEIETREVLAAASARRAEKRPSVPSEQPESQR